MSGDTPAVADTSAADAADVALLDDAAPAETAKPADSAAATPAETPTESKPDGDKPSGDDAAKGDDAPSLLADDDEGTPEKKADGQADADDKGKSPETYEAFTLPEGVALDETLLAKATPVFKSIGEGLKQEDAQKLVTLFAEAQAEAAAQQVAGFNQVKKDWAAEIKADQDFGGEKLPQTLGAAKAVLGKYGDKALLNDLKEWGWANHPGLIRMLARVNAHLSEDHLVTADATSQSEPKSPAERLWPGMFQNNQET